MHMNSWGLPATIMDLGHPLWCRKEQAGPQETLDLLPLARLLLCKNSRHIKAQTWEASWIPKLNPWESFTTSQPNLWNKMIKEAGVLLANWFKDIAKTNTAKQRMQKLWFYAISTNSVLLAAQAHIQVGTVYTYRSLCPWSPWNGAWFWSRVLRSSKQWIDQLKNLSKTCNVCSFHSTGSDVFKWREFLPTRLMAQDGPRLKGKA